MDTLTAYAMNLSAQARGTKMRVFDWDQAAQIIRDRGAQDAAAGLSNDWEWTGGMILLDGQPLSRDDSHCFLASTWATPELEIDGEIIACWRYMDEAPGWDAETFWPESAKRILADA